MDDGPTSLELAMADVEMMRSAFADEMDDDDDDDAAAFPLHVTLRLSPTAHVHLELVDGYPQQTNLQVVSFRSTKDASEHARLETAVAAIRATAEACRMDQMEGGLACCAAALEAWQNGENNSGAVGGGDSGVSKVAADEGPTITISDLGPPAKRYAWVSGEPILDRKSTFVAHLCKIQSERDVPLAMAELMDGNSKLHRASHNMSAYRVTERIIPPSESSLTVLKHDNDDDGEDGAGSRLAHLLQMRGDTGVLVVVSRWFGGIHLGPKRFAHITNAARILLVQECDNADAENRK